MLIDVKAEKQRESRASKALYVQAAVKGRGRRRGRDRTGRGGRHHRGRDRPLPTRQKIAQIGRDNIRVRSHDAAMKSVIATHA
jgi:hypothetical protein